MYLELHHLPPVRTMLCNKRLKIIHICTLTKLSKRLQKIFMNNCLKSLHSVNEAITLNVQLTELLKKAGFHLTKWLSNSKEVLTKISQESKNNLILDVKGSWSRKGL